MMAFSQNASSQKGIVVKDNAQRVTRQSLSKESKKQVHFFQKKLDSIAEIDIRLLHLDKACEIYKDSASEKIKPFKINALTSYYADKFNGRKTASGQVFDNKKLTAAHKTLPFGTRLKVTNEANGKSVEVIVNDRGPFSKGRELDLSKTAFIEITRDIKYGLLRATIEIVE